MSNARFSILIVLFIFEKSKGRFRVDENEAIEGSMPEAVCATFAANPATISYADCAATRFECECCTFCCADGLCECNAADETICDSENE